jgi:hypothetical protein
LQASRVIIPAVCRTARSRLARGGKEVRMEHAHPTRTDVEPIDVAARLRAIKSRLPGQMLQERIDTAKILHGPLYSLREVRARVGATLPRRPGFIRGAALEPIEAYRQSIPDEALLKYDDAAQSGLFSRFMVATPTYYSERQVDPWIIGEVTGTEEWAVLAQWDV